MDLEYRQPLRINHERVQPIRENSCRLSVVANAINFFHGRRVFSPEMVLDIINSRRISAGSDPIDLDKEAVRDEEIEAFVRQNGEGVAVVSVEGACFANLALWDELVAAGFLIAPDHQMIYAEPPDYTRSHLFYFPENLLRRAVFEPEFSYQTFRDIYAFYISRAGFSEDGHVDLVFDVKNIDGLEAIVFANFGSKGNEHPYFVPWDFFRNYLFFDWNGPSIHDPSDFPDETGMEELFEKGTLEYKGRFFFYASMEVYYPEERKRQLDAILEKYSQKAV